MATFHENLKTSFANFKAKYIKSSAAASGGTDLSMVTTGEKYTWNNKSNLALGTTATTAAKGNHTHTTSIATDSGTNQLTMAANTKYKLTAGGSTYIFTTPPDNNTTKGNGIITNAAKTGSGTTVTPTIAAGTTMDNAIGTLLNNDVAINNDLSVIGDTIIQSDSQTNVANNTFVAIVNPQPIPAGTYIVHAWVNFASTNTAGSRLVRFASNAYVSKEIEVSPNQAGYTQLMIDDIVTFDNEVSTFCVQAKQTSGGTMNINGQIKMVRIK